MATPPFFPTNGTTHRDVRETEKWSTPHHTQFVSQFTGTLRLSGYGESSFLDTNNIGSNGKYFVCLNSEVTFIEAIARYRGGPGL